MNSDAFMYTTDDFAAAEQLLSVSGIFFCETFFNRKVRDGFSLVYDHSVTIMISG